MEEENRKGRLCGLIAAGLRLEGLLRVSLERPDIDADTVPQIHEAFEMYSALFNSLFPEDKEPQTPEDEAIPVEEAEQDAEPVHEEIEEETVIPAKEEIEEDISDADEDEVKVEEVEEEIEVAPESLPEPEPEPSRPLSDTLKVDELIARKESADLRRAFTLNDKFRFRRTIFGGSDELFSRTLQELEAMKNFEEALAHLESILPENGEDNDDFIAIIKAHFDSRQ